MSRASVALRSSAMALMLAAAGCGGGEDEEEATPTSTPPVATTEPETPEPAPHEDDDLPQPPARLVRFTGDVVIDHVAVRAGAPLEHGDRITLGEGAEAVIDLDGGDRVTLFGPALAAIGLGAAQMTVGRGTAHLVLSAGPGGPRPPFRVATREASVELVGAGEMLVVESPAGATWIVALSGLAQVTNGEVDARHHARVSELASGHAILVADHPAEPTEAPSRLADARGAADAIFAGLPAADPARRESGLTRSGSDLDAALGWLETEARHGRDLTEQHRAAVTAGNQPEAMRLQGALVGHAQQLHALRDVANARWERLVARVLAGEVAPGAPDPAAARRERVTALLGLEGG